MTTDSSCYPAQCRHHQSVPGLQSCTAYAQCALLALIFTVVQSSYGIDVSERQLPVLSYPGCSNELCSSMTFNHLVWNQHVAAIKLLDQVKLNSVWSFHHSMIDSLLLDMSVVA